MQGAELIRYKKNKLETFLVLFSWFVFGSGIYVLLNFFALGHLFLFAYFLGDPTKVPNLLLVTIIFVVLAIGWMVSSFGIRKMKHWGIYSLVLLELLEVFIYIYQPSKIGFDTLLMIVRVLGTIYLLRLHFGSKTVRKLEV